MASILDDDNEILNTCITSNLLDNWIVEQKIKINKILMQLDTINELPEDKLNELCNYLDDIDYHIAGLANIFSIIVSNTNSYNEYEQENEQENDIPKKWSLVHALWFHMMMMTDPESIYYSSNIGKSAWPYYYIPTHMIP